MYGRHRYPHIETREHPRNPRNERRYRDARRNPSYVGQGNEFIPNQLADAYLTARSVYGRCNGDR